MTDGDANQPDPRDGGRGWMYMDVLLDEYARLKDLEPTNPERQRVEATMGRQRERILALERE
ncbi:hypothetical protein LCGC14_2098370 [marine sediment metagenome]|uniref:Uncharacterized protein n=1 Tax=marine sediment metagenome TaxID=412755 RepID=A0A0F9H739_9ZZZZ